MPWLEIVTFGSSFLFAIVSLWLGIYIVTRNAHRQIAWLSGVTLWGLSFYFAGVYFERLVVPDIPWANGWWGVSIMLIVPTTNHMTHSLIPGRAPSWQKRITPVLYAITAILMILEIFTPWIHIGIRIPLITHTDFEIGPLYPLFLLFVTSGSILALYNLYHGLQQETRPLFRRQYQFMLAAVISALFASGYGTGSTIFQLETPFFLTVFGLGGSVIFICLGVARFNALVEGRLTGRELSYTAIAIGLVTLLFLIVSWISSSIFNVEFSVYVALIMTAVASHAIYDWARTYLDRVFYHRRYGQIRRDVREIFRNIYGEDDMASGFSMMLQNICESLQVTGASIVVVNDGETVYEQSATWHMNVDPDSIGQIFLSNPTTNHLQDIMTFTLENREPDVVDIGLATPLFVDEKLVGVIVLGDKHSGMDYVTEEINLIDEFSDSIASLLQIERLKSQQVQQVNQLLDDLSQSEQSMHANVRKALSVGGEETSDGLSQQQLLEFVTDALRNFHDMTHLGEQPFSKLKIIEEMIDDRESDALTVLDRGRGVQRVITQIIEKLRPDSERTSPPTREWYQYIILRDSYLEGRLNRDVMSDLFISESTFHRNRRQAVRGVANVLYGLEMQLITPSKNITTQMPVHSLDLPSSTRAAPTKTPHL